MNKYIFWNKSPGIFWIKIFGVFFRIMDHRKARPQSGPIPGFVKQIGHFQIMISIG